MRIVNRQVSALSDERRFVRFGGLGLFIQFFREGGTGFEDVPHKCFRQIFGEDVAVDVFFQHAAVYRFPFLAVRRDGSAVLQAVFEVCHFMNEYDEHDVWRQVVVQRYEVSAVGR